MVKEIALRETENESKTIVHNSVSTYNSNFNACCVVENNPSTVAIDYCAKNNIRLFSDYKRILSSWKKEFDLGIFCLPTSKAAVIQ